MGKTPCTEKIGLKKGPWTEEEDQKLIDYIKKHGHAKWRTVPLNAGLKRCGKSCRLRWTNYLRPDIKRGRYSFEEEETIIYLHSILGNKWSAIAACLPGRTDNEIKNYWNTRIRKRLLRMGIDPITHSPLLDLSELYSINSLQLDIQNLFGIQIATGPNLLNLVSSISSSQCKNPQNFPQNLQENQFSSPQNQNQFQSFHPNQLHSTIQEFQACTKSTSTSSSTPFLNDTLLMQANIEQFSPSFTNMGSKNYLPSLCHYNGDHSTYIGHSLVSPAEYGYVNDNRSFLKDQMFQSNNNNDTNNFGLGSVMSTPSSSSTHMNSTTTHEDTYCSNMMLDITNGLDFDGFM